MAQSQPDGLNERDQQSADVSERFERNTAVNGTPDDDGDDAGDDEAINHGQSATDPAEGGDEKAPPNDGSPQG